MKLREKSFWKSKRIFEFKNGCRVNEWNSRHAVAFSGCVQDEHMNVGEVRAHFGNEIEQASLKLFGLMSDVARKQGIIIADTKLEFGTEPQTGKLTLGDARFTPDSSRFWLLDDWKKSREEGRSPISFDKQFVRGWGKTVGIDNLDPLREDDVKYVHGLTVPSDVLAQTSQLYRYIFYLLTGLRLEVFQREKIGI